MSFINSQQYPRRYLTIAAFLFILFFLHITSNVNANSDTLKFFGYKTKSDSVFNFNAIQKFTWDVSRFNSEGKRGSYLCDYVDTITFNRKAPEGLLLSTFFYADSSLLHKIHSLSYKVKGSIRIIINGQIIVNEGIFDKKKYADSKAENHGFANFTLQTQKNHLQILFVPKPGLKTNKIAVNIGSPNWAKKIQESEHNDIVRGYSVAYFYFAFAIMLILIYFFIKNKEYLFFGLFCLFSSFQYFTENMNQSTLIRSISISFLLISLELLSIFMALAITKINKSKIPLFILFLLLFIPLFPSYDYALTTNFGPALEIPLFEFVAFIVFVIFSSFSFLYYWIQGFGQKKWEIKVLTWGTLIAIFLFIFPISLAINDGASSRRDNYYLSNILISISACVYPILVAIVLSKRYGNNQKQLTNQLVTIKQLANENLTKETEKKKILEEQNVFLETKVKERTNELAVKNELISVKNKEITDSLVYAKRIQSAILPDIKLIYKALEQSFILFLPKDIVSGDFYGFAQKDGKVIIAAADCTGHGVAGAFMSMIGSSLLNAIINERHITTPAKILDELNEGIIHSLKQRESESNDGMDISICAFDLINNTVQFAGANRPLWLVRNNELIIYKPNKIAIGGLQILHDENYTNHEIVLQKNDTLYLFSDGFADQFGGDKGKKLMSKIFKDNLLVMQHLNMQQQENELKKLFINWKGDNEQVDDVLVIGIRV